MYRMLLSGVLLLLAVMPASAQVLSAAGEYNLARGLYFIEDKNKSLDINAVINEQNWSLSNKETGNFGFSTSRYWIKIPLNSEVQGRWLFELDYPLLDYVDIYWVENGEVIYSAQTGDNRPFAQRPLPFRQFVFYRMLQPGQEATLYYALETEGTFQITLNAYDEVHFERRNMLSAMVYGGFYGVFIVMAVYNLLVFFITRIRAYVYYVVFVLGFCILQMAYSGTGYQYLWPDHPEFNALVFPLVYALSQVTLLAFAANFLGVFTMGRWLGRYFYVLMMISAGLGLAFLLAPYHKVMPMLVLHALLVNLSAFVVSFWLAVRGKTYAGIYALASGIFIIGMFLTNLRSLGVVEGNFLTLHGYMIGSFLEVVLFALALAYRIADIQKAKRLAEKSAHFAQGQAIANLQKYERLYDSAVTGNFVLDRDGILLSANSTLQRYLGDEYREFKRYFQPQDALLALLAECKIKGQVNDATLCAQNGRWFSVSMKWLGNETGTIEGSLTDIQARVDAEHLRMKAEDDKSNALEKLVVGIAHSVNTPLGIAMTSTDFAREQLELLQREYKQNTLTREYFNTAVMEGQSSLQIAQQNLSRMGILLNHFKQISVKQMAYNVGELYLAELAEITRLAASSAGITLSLHLDENAHFLTFPEAVKFILQQWLQNTVAHAQNDKGVAISLTVKIYGGHLHVHYRDNGQLLAASELKHIFDPFYTSQRGSGRKLGLGLYQVKNTVHQLLHGTLETYIDNGLHFKMQIPTLGLDAKASTPDPV
ncbi:MAG: sensor histidine kinase [Oceanospirillaceae bacterium]|nr:sensor histidine kinase [Oceanospirillaceae bacterium]